MHRTPHVLGVLVVALLLAAGCSVSIGGGEISAEDLESQATEQFLQQFPVDSVDCPDPLPSEVDASVECTLVSEGSAFVMRATVTEVDGDTASISYELTEEL